MSGEAAIVAKDLTRKFGSFIACDRITFEVRAGEVFGFLGANGAGKTTAIRMLTGLLSPSSGQATVAGYDVYTASESIKRHIGYMSQRFSLYEDLTVAENIQLYGGIYDLTDRQIRDRRDAMLARLGFRHAAGELVRAIPLGWRQKLAFSVALLHQPRIVFLDEPTSGVDPITRRQFWEMIYEAASSGTTVFVTDPLHGRGRILRSHFDHGRGRDRRDRHAIRVENAVRSRVRRRGVRAPRPPDRSACGPEARSMTASSGQSSALRRASEERDLSHSARSPNAHRHHADTDPPGDHLRLRDPHRRAARSSRDRGSGRRTTSHSHYAAASARRTPFASSPSCTAPPKSTGYFSAATRREPSSSSPGLPLGLDRGFRRACRSFPTRPSRTREARCRRTRFRSFRLTSASFGQPRAGSASCRRFALDSIRHVKAPTSSCPD